MGSYCSIHNDTRDETVMVYLGANTELIKPLLIAISGLATAASSGAAWGVIPRIVGTVTVGAADTTLVVSVGALTAAASGVVSAKHTHRTNGHWPSLCLGCAHTAVWDVNDQRLKDRIKQLKEYKKKYGHCSMPFNYKPDQSLAHWVHGCRREYKLYQDGKASDMTPQRIAELEKLGFVWKSDFPRKFKKERKHVPTEMEDWENCSINFSPVFMQNMVIAK